MAAVLLTMDKTCQEIALATLADVLAAQETHAGALTQLAHVKKDKGDVQEATKLFVRLLIRDKDNNSLKYNPRLLLLLTTQRETLYRLTSSAYS